MKGATEVSAKKSLNINDFNPRSHEGSDPIDAVINSICKISIHAPMKGATFLVFHKPDADEISIHAPMKGAT